MRKIAICGTTPSRALAPVSDESWEIWTIGPGGKDAHRWDRLFEMHTTWPEDFKGYLNDLSLVKRPQAVYTLVPMKEQIRKWAHGHDKDDKWLNETITGKWSSNVVLDRSKFMMNEIVDGDGYKYLPEWFSSSISYCIALAIEEGAEEIGLWGIDLESGEEYLSQKSGCRNLLREARRAGIKVHLPEGCGLEVSARPYPDKFETRLALTLEKKAGWLAQLVADAEPRYDAVRLEANRTEGRLLQIREIKALPFPFHDEFKKWADDQEAGLQNHLNGMSVEVKRAAESIAHLKGEKSATQFYRRTFVWGEVEPDE